MDLFTPRLVREFAQYHYDNPHIYEAFVYFSRQAIAAGRTHIGARQVLERIRWDTMLAGDDGYKVNNNYTPFYARKFMADHPAHVGLFALREAAADQMETTE